MNLIIVQQKLVVECILLLVSVQLFNTTGQFSKIAKQSSMAVQFTHKLIKEHLTLKTQHLILAVALNQGKVELYIYIKDPHQ